MMGQAIRRFLVGDDGSAIIEFTLLAPLLVVMSIYTMDFGLAFYTQMRLQNAAQAGVDWAIANHIFNNGSITAAAINAANNQPNNMNVSVSAGYPIEQCGCPSSTGVTLTANTAPAPCPLCNTLVGGITVTSDGGLYVTVQTEATYNSLTGYGLFSNATPLTAKATTRIQ
jgi:Flp pilus assembly protein TadG